MGYVRVRMGGFASLLSFPQEGYDSANSRDGRQRTWRSNKAGRKILLTVGRIIVYDPSIHKFPFLWKHQADSKR